MKATFDVKFTEKMKKAAPQWFSPRSEAAKKAWETRRKNEQHKKRSEAAKKAWVTIRANKTK